MYVKSLDSSEIRPRPWWVGPWKPTFWTLVGERACPAWAYKSGGITWIVMRLRFGTWLGFNSRSGQLTRHFTRGQAFLEGVHALMQAVIDEEARP